jgi:hypothetical protein
MDQCTPQTKPRARRKRADTALIFDPAQKVPDPVLDALLEEWLVPCLVEQFLREHGITRESLSARYRTPE